MRRLLFLAISLFAVVSCKSMGRSLEEKIRSAKLNDIDFGNGYHLANNLNADSLIEMDNIISHEEYRLKNTEGWWILYNSISNKIIHYEPTSLILGFFEYRNQTLIYNEGTGLERRAFCYNAENGILVHELDIWGRNSVKISSGKKYIAYTIKTNASFVEGIDKYIMARIGIIVIDEEGNRIFDALPKSDGNYQLISFDDDILRFEFISEGDKIIQSRAF